MHHSLSIATRGHVPLSTLKSLQLASDGLLYTAAAAPLPPAPPVSEEGGAAIEYDFTPYRERRIKPYEEDQELMELAKMIITSGILD